MNKNKLLKVSLFAIIVLILIICIVIIAINSNNDEDNEEKKLDGGVHMETFEGEIIEIKEDNTIIVEITNTHTDEFDNGEKVTMKVGNIIAFTESEYDIEHEMQTGDNISTQFWKKDLETVDGEYYLDLEKIGSTLNIYL